MSVSQADVESSAKIRHVPLSFHSAELQTSALRLILSLFPDWEQTEGKVEFVRFTDGITNTVSSLPSTQDSIIGGTIDQC